MAIVQDGTRWFSVNFSPTAGNGTTELLWEWAQVLEAAGWIGVQSGNGTAKTAGFPVANPFVAATTGWIQMRAPTGTLEITIQRDSGDDYSTRAYLSLITFGLGGTASAPPAPPGGTDSYQFIGNTGSYDVNFAWGAGDASQVRWAICADSTAHRGFYYFHIVGRVLTTAAAHRAFFFDTVNSFADGTIGSADAAPFFLLKEGAGVLPFEVSGLIVIWYKRGLGGEALDTGADHKNPFPTLNQNPYTGVHDMGTVLVNQDLGNVQIKGTSNTLRFCSSATIGFYDTTDLATVGSAKVHFENGLLLPWPSGVAPSP